MESKKQMQSARRKQEAVALNRLLIWFAIAIGYEALVLLIKRYYVNFNGTDLGISIASALSSVFFALQFVAPALTIAAAVWLMLCKKQGKPLTKPAILTAAMAALWFTALVTYFGYGNGVDLLGVVAPAAAILSMIYYLYQREFFCSTVIAGCGILCLWLYRRYYADHPNVIRVGYVLAWVLLAAAAVVFWKLSKNGGKWGKYRIFPADIAYLPAYATCILTAAVLAAALFAGTTVAFYAIFVLVIWLFCLAVYYTVRLM